MLTSFIDYKYGVIRYEELTLALTNKDRSIWNLENELMALQGKCTMIQHEVTRMKELELVILKLSILMKL